VLVGLTYPAVHAGTRRLWPRRFSGHAIWSGLMPLAYALRWPPPVGRLGPRAGLRGTVLEPVVSFVSRRRQLVPRDVTGCEGYVAAGVGVPCIVQDRDVLCGIFVCASGVPGRASVCFPVDL